MAESFPSTIAANILTKMDFLAFAEIRLSSRVRKEITKAKQILCDVKDAVLNAEAQQAQNCKLHIGLEKLSELLYDAEDVLDELKCEVLAKQVSKLSAIIYYGKIKDIRKKLDEKAADIRSIDDENKQEVRRVYSGEMGMNNSFVGTSKVFGRDEDNEKIVRFLTEPNREDVRVSVIPIVRTAGMGKTTLATLVYCNKRVDETFDLKMWVRVPENFDIIRLMKETYTSATGQNPAELSVHELEDRLLEALVSKKYLLVLDNVLNENKKKWVKFKKLLMQEANGSKIVVTTRSDQVASITGTVPVCKLGTLHDGEEERNLDLDEIADKFVTKCRGIPISLRILGTLHYGNINKHDWLLIHRSRHMEVSTRGK
ncbi:putative disease resistance protein RGA3 [Pistacia vera]|uniref:putative disease resistance protein RGA3 n=1 Tax=Pistacia vera TaxID=55513 RepID=UPI001262F80D|nr:putative disease resistance protein RGA3 [Pistacia vera]